MPAVTGLALLKLVLMGSVVHLVNIYIVQMHMDLTLAKAYWTGSSVTMLHMATAITSRPGNRMK